MGKRFRVPVQFHGPALRAFIRQEQRDNREEEIYEYLTHAVREYSPEHIIDLVHSIPQLRTCFADIMHEQDTMAQMPAAAFLKCVQMGAIPRALIPETPDAFSDAKSPSPSLFAAAAYIEWLQEGTRLNSGHVPDLTRAIGQAIASLPTEVRELITRHLFTDARALCEGAV